MRYQWILGIGFLLAGMACAEGKWIEVPAHAIRSGEVGGFELGDREVTVSEFVAFLNGGGIEGFPDTAQIERISNGKYKACRGVERQAVSEVALPEAEAYGRWCSQKSGQTVRLPTEAEWEVAARGGVDGAPYSWGWGGDPSERAQFDASAPASRGAYFPANGFGLYDMAGNLYEWCAPGSTLEEGQGIARGGSWAEHDPSCLKVAHRQIFEKTYRGQDVGFRMLREADRKK